jgi:hypothetical protein
MEMLLILLGEIFIAYLAYPRAKADGTLTEVAPKVEPPAPYVPNVLGPDATRLGRILNWLGLEETDD